MCVACECVCDGEADRENSASRVYLSPVSHVSLPVSHAHTRESDQTHGLIGHIRSSQVRARTSRIYSTGWLSGFHLGFSLTVRWSIWTRRICRPPVHSSTGASNASVRKETWRLNRGSIRGQSGVKCGSNIGLPVVWGQLEIRCVCAYEETLNCLLAALLRDPFLANLSCCSNIPRDTLQDKGTLRRKTVESEYLEHSELLRVHRRPRGEVKSHLSEEDNANIHGRTISHPVRRRPGDRNQRRIACAHGSPHLLHTGQLLPKMSLSAPNSSQSTAAHKKSVKNDPDILC